MRLGTPRRRKLIRLLVTGAICACVLALTGCRTVKFYAQAVKGQCQILAAREPIRKLINDPETPKQLKDRFHLLAGIRYFAGTELKLPVDDQYSSYADVGRPYVVWNVQAAQEFSMEPKEWWYPFVGSLAYRGYFSPKDATNYAAFLRKKGYETYVRGATAYSTLGFFKDPVLNTFVFHQEAHFAETIFHELAHQQVFASGDTDFNEGFATFTGREAVRRWLASRQNSELYSRYMAELQREDAFANLVLRTRDELEKLFGDRRDEKGKVRATSAARNIPPAELRSRKEAIYAEMREKYQTLKASWGGDPTYDRWFSTEINNAKLNSVAAYYDLVPGFKRLLEINDNDLAKYYEAAERLSKMSKEERHQWLRTLGSQLSDQYPRPEGPLADVGLEEAGSFDPLLSPPASPGAQPRAFP